MGFLWYFTLGAAAIYLFFGLVLGYHWIRYSMSTSMALISFAFYLIGGGFLLLLLIGATGALSA